MVGADAVGVGLLGSAVVLGLRHGLDVDHVAAIGDIAGTEPSARRALGLSTVYALAHGAVVLVLGSVAVVAGSYVPPSLDDVMGRLAGATLLVLGAQVLLGLVRHGAAFRVRSRWSLVLEALAAVRGRLRDRPAVVEFEHDHPHDHRRPHGHDHQRVRGPDEHGAVVVGHRHPHRHRGVLPGAAYGWRAAAGVGVVHGVGAETPTQVVLLVTAAGAGGDAVGLSVLGSFLVGLLLANTAVAVVAAAGARTGAGRVALAAAASALSIVVGAVLLLG